MELDQQTHRHRTCTGKQPFTTRTEAEGVAARKAKEWPGIDGVNIWLEVYHCPYCHLFHFGRNYLNKG